MTFPWLVTECDLSPAPLRGFDATEQIKRWTQGLMGNWCGCVSSVLFGFSSRFIEAISCTLERWIVSTVYLFFQAVSVGQNHFDVIMLFYQRELKTSRNPSHLFLALKETELLAAAQGLGPGREPRGGN